MAETYTVKKGDRPGDLALQFYDDWNQWRLIMEANPDAFSTPGDPRTLQIGAVLTIPDLDDAAADDETPPAADTGSTSDAVIPPDGRLLVVKDPAGSDADRLYYIVYEVNGTEIVYEIGDKARLDEVFGGVEFFESVSTVSQSGFDESRFVLGGSADTILGQSETITSQIEREMRLLGMEDLPSWIRDDADAMFLVNQAAAQGWSEGRLWTELSETTAFETRFGAGIDRYLTGGRTVGEAVDQMISEEEAFRSALRPFAATAGFEVTNDYIHGLMENGWTPQATVAVLAAADTLRENPLALEQANAVLEFSGLPTLDEVSFINALEGHGAPEVIEALNTAAAGTALAAAGLDDVDLDLLTAVVDTSDRILTAESFAALAQELTFNLIRFGSELDRENLGLTDEDVFAAAFGRESPSGRTAGEVFNLLGRFERDRQAKAGGHDASTAFQNEEGRLVIQGLEGL